jgi:hypothetical protein
MFGARFHKFHLDPRRPALEYTLLHIFCGNGWIVQSYVRTASLGWRPRIAHHHVCIVRIVRIVHNNHTHRKKKMPRTFGLSDRCLFGRVSMLQLDRGKQAQGNGRTRGSLPNHANKSNSATSLSHDWNKSFTFNRTLLCHTPSFSESRVNDIHSARSNGTACDMGAFSLTFVGSPLPPRYQRLWWTGRLFCVKENVAF